MKKIATRLKGVPSVLLVVGAGFIMAAGSDLRAAVGMSIAVFASLVLSALAMTLLSKVIPAYAKLPAYLLVITGFVSLISMLLQAYFPAAADVLGVQLAALAVSLVAFRGTQEDQTFAVSDALITGVFFAVLMVVCALIREVLGNATLWGQPIAFLQSFKISTLAGAFGGYLVLSVVLAVINKLTGIKLKLICISHWVVSVVH